ncbi:MAG: peptidylprolyl isomerase [Lentisphaerota bacterium]
MKKKLAIIMSCAGLAATGLRADVSASAQAIDSYAALVNERVITVGDVLTLVQPVEQQLRELHEGAILEAKLKEAYQSSLTSLIERALILEEFKTLGGALPERAVEDYVNSIIHDRFNGDRSAFLAVLAEERMTLGEWRDEMKERLIVNILRRQEVNDRIIVSPMQISKAYKEQLDKFKSPEKIQLRMIVIHQGELDSDKQAKKEQADKILARLKAGEDFATVAKATSEGSKAQQGGDLGWLEPSSLRPELARATETLRPPEVSEVIAAGEEYYILKLEARQKAAVKPFSQVQGDIEDELRDVEGQRLYKAWIKRLKNKFYVKTFSNKP